MSLLTLQDAKDHLQVDHDSSDADIQNKLDQAESIIIDFLKLTDLPAEWQEGTGDSPGGSTVPHVVRSSVLLVLGELYENREAAAADVLSPAVKDLLRRLRDPALK